MGELTRGQLLRLNRVIAAWEQTSRNSPWHERWKARLFREWPALAHAIDDLAKEMKRSAHNSTGDEGDD